MVECTEDKETGNGDGIDGGVSLVDCTEDNETGSDDGTEGGLFP